jgi:hypothetical protein
LILDAMAAVKGVLNYLFHNTVGPLDDHVAPQIAC